MSEDVKVLHSVVSLDYERSPTLAARQYTDAVRQQRLVGHRCPECQRIYTPPKGYCPVCTVPTGEEHQEELPTTGVLVNYTVTNPDKLHQQGGQSSARGNVMLDGTHISLMGEILGVPTGDVHSGMRLQAVWEDLAAGEVAGGWGYGAPGIRGWEPSGEPDASPEEVKQLLKEAGEE